MTLEIILACVSLTSMPRRQAAQGPSFHFMTVEEITSPDEFCFCGIALCFGFVPVVRFYPRDCGPSCPLTESQPPKMCYSAWLKPVLAVLEMASLLLSVPLRLLPFA